MNSPLQSTYSAADAMTAPVSANMEHGIGEEEGHAHIHMPNGSLWPFIISIAVVITMIGLMVVNTTPWISIIAAPFILVGILGWALEDPFAARTEGKRSNRVPTNYAEAASFGRPTALAEAVLQDAQDVADRTVTVRSTEWSAHPVKVEIESEGVVLALYGKVELEAQRKALEEQLLRVPGVIDVKNFLVAEDTILNAANAAIDRLRQAGKLEGAKDINVLVENYIVSLYGETPNSAMKYLLERELVGLPGVKVVVNHINLNEDIPGNLGRTKNC